MKRDWHIASIVVTLIVAAGVLSPVWAEEPIARPSVGATSITWSPNVENEGFVLTVTGPERFSVRRELEAGETPVFEVVDAQGKRLPDGSYFWELRANPVVPGEIKERLRAARAAGRGAEVELGLWRTGQIPREDLVLSGSFTILGGTIVPPDLPEEGAGRQGDGRKASSTSRLRSGPASSGLTPTVEADQVILDDLVVQGSLCAGFDCVNNESFGFDTIRLKENNTRIKLEDTSSTSFHPSNDWQLTANDAVSGGANKLSVEDITSARVPFTLTAGAASNSIYVNDTGRVGFRTSTPVLDLHVNTSNTPGIRLEQNSSGGLTAQTWDVAGDEVGFFVRDVTGGSRLPFRIRPGAPTSSIDINANGHVGFGTANPEAKVDVQGNTAADSAVSLTTFSDTNSPQVVYRRTRGTSSVPTAVLSGDVLGSLGFRGHTGTSIPNTNSALVLAVADENWTSTANGSRLNFNTTPIGAATQQTRMTIKGSGNVGIGTLTPQDKLEVSGGNIRVTGGSFIDDGTTLNVPDYVFEPDYKLMSLAELKGFIEENGHLPNVPNRDEVKSKGLNLSQFQMRLLEKVEELTLYTVQQHDHIQTLQEQNTALLERLTALEKALGTAAPTAQPR